MATSGRQRRLCSGRRPVDTVDVVVPASSWILLALAATGTLRTGTDCRAAAPRCAAVSTNPVVYAELPGAQHAFDVFHSIRSTHAVRAVDRYLTWHWNTWRHGLRADSGVGPEELGDDAGQAGLSPG